MNNHSSRRVSSYSILFGVVIAGLFAVYGSLTNNFIFALVFVGSIVGFISFVDTDVRPFLISGISILIASFVGRPVLNILPFFSAFFDSIVMVFTPGVIVAVVLRAFRPVVREY